MSGFPHRRQIPNQDDLTDLTNESNQLNQRWPAGRRSSATSSIGPIDPASPSRPIDSLRTSQDLMSASVSMNPAFFTGGPAMGSWQGQLGAARQPSLAARMAHAQRTQQFQQQQQQQAVAAQFQLQQQQQAAAAAQEERNLDSLLLQKRQIDEMILNSAFNSRRLSMDSNFPSFAGTGRFPGQAGGPSFPMPMSASAASMIGIPNAGGLPNTEGNHNISIRPMMGETDLLTGKIGRLQGRGSAMQWADGSQRFSDPRLGMGMMNQGGPSRGAPAQSGPPFDYEDSFEEEADEVYFDDTETDEVDRDFKRSQENFPLKLYRIIYEVVKSGRGDVISFFPHGRAFAVHKPKEFINEIMPKYFATGRMNTFLKQLNLYGFCRITEGRDKGGYFHPKFILGKRLLCKGIKRKKTDSKPAAKAAAKGTKSPERKETDTSRSNSPLNAEEYAKTLAQQMKKSR